MTDLDEPDSILPTSARLMLSSPDRPPRAWVAVVLSLVMPGLGHAVRGRWQRALGWWVGFMLASLALSVRWQIVATLALSVVGRVLVAIDARRTPPTVPPPSTGRAWALAFMLIAVALIVGETTKRTIVELFSSPSGSIDRKSVV